MHENEISNEILNASFKVHTALGPGLLESAYKECLFYELKKRGLHVEKEKPLPLIYEDVKLEIGYRVDLLVENKVIIELKSVESLNDVHLAQVITYLKLSDCKLGLLMNFNVKNRNKTMLIVVKLALLCFGVLVCVSVLLF
jgi:GxxExxY protein